MNFFQTTFTNTWEVRIPYLVRYLDKKYVDLFFEKGLLRIPSFKKFRNDYDIERGDVFEGRTAMQIQAPNSEHSIIGINGQKAFILCCSTIEDTNMQATFNTKSGFRVINPTAFAHTISRYINGFIAGMEGLCCYRENLLINKETGITIRSPEDFSDPEEYSKYYDHFVGTQIKESFFLKKLKYAHQGEYRFIWFAEGLEEEYIDIICPEAIKYCQRID